MARIAIVGPGAVGGVIATRLHQSGTHRIVLCARRSMAELTVTTDGDTPIVWQPAVLTDPTSASPVDWVLVATKAYDNAGAAAWFPALCANGARVAILQNGVEHREHFKAWIPETRIVPVMVDCPAERSTPTQIRQRGSANLAVGDDAAGREFAVLFDGTRVAVRLTADFKSKIWRKLCVNCAGAISAILLQPAGIMRDERIADVARGFVRECIAVGRAEGAQLDDTLVERVIEGYRHSPPDSMNSLHADRAAARPMEIDTRNGVIVRLGRKHGIPTPFNEMAVALLEASR